MLANFDLLSADPAILGGKPCIHGTRISVAMILEWLASGADRQDILTAYPQISEEAYNQALQYAALQVQHQISFDIEIAA